MSQIRQGFLRLCGGLMLALVSFVFSVQISQATGYNQLMDTKDTQWLNVIRPLDESDFKGRLLLLDFWTYGCINCIHVIPDLEALEEKYGDKLLVIGVHSAKFEQEKTSHNIMKAVQRFGLKHPIINDAGFDIWRAFGVRAWPTLVLLDEQGKEISRYSGEGHRDDLDQDIHNHLKNKNLEVKQDKIENLIVADTKEGVLRFPARMAFASDTPWGEVFFIADSGHNRLLVADLSGQIKKVIGSGQAGMADGNFAEAQFNNPRGLTMLGGVLYVADTDNHALRRVDLEKETVTRIAGDGRRGGRFWPFALSNTSISLASPWDLEPMADGQTLAIAMAGNHQLWSYDTKEDKLSVIAGSGIEDIRDASASSAALAQPSGVSLQGPNLYFVDTEVSALRVLTPENKVRTLIGTGLFDFGHVDGAYPKARLQHPQGLFADKDRVYVADTYNNAIRIYTFATQKLTTMPLEQLGIKLEEPGDVLIHDGTLYVVNTNQHVIERVELNSEQLEKRSAFPLSF